MKKIFKSLIVFILIIPMMIIFSACDSNSSSASVISIEKTATEGYEDTYTITYDNGKTYSFTVTNGTNGVKGDNGTDYDLTKIYEAAVEAGFQGDLIDFLDKYIDLDETRTTLAVNKALVSAVSVYSNFKGTEKQMFMGQIYSREVEYSSAGSGVIYSIDKNTGSAFIITNYHVIYDKDSNGENGISEDISIYLYGYQNEESKISATFYGGSINHDIAVLKVENNVILKNSDATAVSVRDSNDILVGETAIAIGNPEALGISATSGIVSVDSEYISMSSLDGTTTNSHRVIRIDSAVNGGNSGGGLFDNNGNLIGIVNAKISDTTTENIAFAIPSNIAIGIAENIISNNGNFNRLTLGITLSSENTRSYFNKDTLLTEIVEDVIIKEVESGSFADNLNLQVNDKILKIKINDYELKITRMFEVIDVFYKVKVGDKVEIEIENKDIISFTAIESNFQIIN